MATASGQLQIERSTVDENRFGIRIARARITRETLPAALEFCRQNKVKLMIARSSIFDIAIAQDMERQGFLLMDTLVYFARDLIATPIPSDTGSVLVRPVNPGEEDQVKKVASEAFRGYLGHYHADDRLDRAKADEGYTEWAVRSCLSREVAGRVLVADLNGKIVGFSTLRLNNPQEGEVALNGVAPEAQGHGIYRSLMIRAMEWFRSQGAERMIISTQINNVAPQKVWARVGFVMSHGYYTFHKWFDE